MKTTSPHRPEIQGLRAVAALLVAVYHIWFNRVSGGVDVFIVVSGFLITSSLLRQAESTGRIAFTSFWGGLARRLFPAAFAVLWFVVIASLLWMPRHRWIATIGDVAASGLYVENWLLAFRSVDYLAPTANASPLQHFWALSVQGQMYLLWPLLLALCVALARRTGIPLRRVAIAGLATVFALSLAYSVVRTGQNQAFTYFDTSARVWEFALGGLVATALPWLRLRPWQRVLAGWTGLVAILACGVVLQVSTVFPGYAALWPTGAAMLILLSHGGGSAFGADRLLSWRPLTILGDQSYSVYLWHWPVLAFYRLRTGSTTVSLAAGAAIIVSSIVIAAAVTKFLESPIRRGAAGRAAPRPRRVVALALAPLALVVVAWGTYSSHARRLDGRILAIDDPRYPGAAVMDTIVPSGAPDGVRLHPGPMAVKTDRPSMLQAGCFQSFHESDPLTCTHGDPNATRAIAAVGGSYVAHWIPALEAFAREAGWKVITYTKNRCDFNAEPRIVNGEVYQSCVEWNRRVLDELLRTKPDIVFTRATRGAGLAESVPHGAVVKWRRLTAAGMRIVAVRTTPRFPFDVPDCVARHGPDAEECRLPRDVALAPGDPTDRWEEGLPGVHFIDMTGYFCTDTSCPPVIGNLLVYSDDGHITTHYARTLAPMLERELSRVTAEVEAGGSD